MKSTSPFPPNKGQPSASMTRSQRQQSEVEQRINEILFHSMQLQRTLWLAVRKHGGTIILNETETNPLWNLEYGRNPDNKDEIVITATLLSEPTDEQLTKLEAMLVGKTGDPGDAFDKVGLGNYPKSYVVKALQPRIIFASKTGGKDGVWMTRAEFDSLQKEPPPTQPKTQNGL